MIFRRLVSLVILFIFSISIVFTQNVTPAPIEEGEIPLWAMELRRFEIVSFGSLPFAMMLSSVGYDSYRYFSHGRDSNYAPWPFKKASSAGYTEKEQKYIFFTALGISLSAALVDQAVRFFVRKKERRLEADRQKGNIIITPVENGDLFLPGQEADIHEEEFDAVDEAVISSLMEVRKIEFNEKVEKFLINNEASLISLDNSFNEKVLDLE